MIQVALPEQVVEKLRDTAVQEGTDLSDVIERALDHYLAHSSPKEKARETSTTIPRWKKKRQQIEEEQRAYKEQHARILANHAGQYIAMVQGKIIDHDRDGAQLSRRIRSRFGNAPVLITPVLSEPIQTFVVRSPRLAQEERQ